MICVSFPLAIRNVAFTTKNDNFGDQWNNIENCFNVNILVLSNHSLTLNYNKLTLFPASSNFATSLRREHDMATA